MEISRNLVASWSSCPYDVGMDKTRIDELNAEIDREYPGPRSGVTKWCSGHGDGPHGEVPVEAFTSADRSACRLCRRLISRKSRDVRAAADTLRCSRCERDLVAGEFYRGDSYCVNCRKTYAKQRRASDSVWARCILKMHPDVNISENTLVAAIPNDLLCPVTGLPINPHSKWTAAEFPVIAKIWPGEPLSPDNFSVVSKAGLFLLTQSGYSPDVLSRAEFWLSSRNPVATST